MLKNSPVLGALLVIALWHVGEHCVRRLIRWWWLCLWWLIMMMMTMMTMMMMMLMPILMMLRDDGDDDDDDDLVDVMDDPSQVCLEVVGGERFEVGQGCGWDVPGHYWVPMMMMILAIMMIIIIMMIIMMINSYDHDQGWPVLQCGCNWSLPVVMIMIIIIIFIIINMMTIPSMMMKMTCKAWQCNWWQWQCNWWKSKIMRWKRSDYNDNA